MSGPKWHKDDKRRRGKGVQPARRKQQPIRREWDNRPAAAVRPATVGAAMTGTIKKLVGDKGFGFIRGEDGVEYFFHRSGVAAGEDFGRLKEGDSVSFLSAEGQKGPRAVDVELG